MTLNNPLSSLSINTLFAFVFVLSLLVGIVFDSVAYAGVFCRGEQEKAEITRQQIVGEWPLRQEEDEIVGYVKQLGYKLAANYSETAALMPWRFYLVRNLRPNAFAIGAGNVFVSEGAITFAQNEEELAAILAHELGHELAGHFCKKNRVNTSGNWFDFLIYSPPPAEWSETIELGSVRQTIDIYKEQQADQIALSVLIAAGYDPGALLRVTKQLPPDGEGHWFDQRRIKSLERLLNNYPLDAAMPRDSEQFQRIKQILLQALPLSR